MKRTLLFSALGLLLALTALAQKPTFHKFDNSESTVAMGMSNNGRWVMVDPTTYSASGARQFIYDTQTGQALYPTGHVNDISDDGNTYVGSNGGGPAVYDKPTDTWTKLPVPDSCYGVSIYKMTPDGHYAIGSASFKSTVGKNYLYPECGLLWDLQKKELIPTPNIPLLDMTHEDQGQQRFGSISDDGRYVIGSMSFSFVYPASLFGFIYDVKEQKCEIIGFTPSDTSDWTPVIPGIYFVDGACISPNGKWVAAGAYYDKYLIDGVSNLDQYSCTLLLNRETGEYKLINSEAADQDMVPNFVDDEGNVYVSAPSANPYRDWYVRHGNIWYSFYDVLKQAYGIDFYASTSYDNTGTLVGISADGKTIAAVPGFTTGESYLCQLPQSLVETVKTVNLLHSYTATPASGTRMSKVSSLSILFGQDIKQVSTDATAAKLYDSQGNLVRSSAGCTASQRNSKMLNVVFRPQELNAGETYTVVIPAGVVCMKGDETKLNEEIRLTYTGRGMQPLGVARIYPADGSELSKLDNSSNAVYLAFDAAVQVTDTASARLIRESDETTICKLQCAAQDTMFAVYPTSTQFLYDGQNYRIEIDRGSVVDLSGNGANDPITIHYGGTFVRELNTQKDSVFYDNFNNISQSLKNWMRYEGDHLTPTSAMQSWAFDADNQPWNFSIRESSTSTDYCAASTSMYTPAGKSDDWMVIPQLYVSDANYTLYFDAQSYLETKNDTLRVLVWEHDANINDLTDQDIAAMKAEGKIVYEERLSAGLTEEDLSGDWEQCTVDLSEFAGKNIYVAFWNSNENQSAIFVDNVLVKHDLQYTMAFSNEESVVAASGIDIKGRITIKADDADYSSVTLTLIDADGNEIDTFSQTGLSLSAGSTLDFAFDKPLPLTVGQKNDFTIHVALDDYTDNVESSIKNLAFQTEKRVLLEEFTGITCSNCPLGIIAIDKLKQTYGSQFIPVSIHTYTGDPYASGLGGYSSFLGLTGAPSGIIQRSGIISYPMWQSPLTGDYELSNGSTLWYDLVQSEMDVPADINFEIGEVTRNDRTFHIPFSICSGLTAKNQNLGVFAVVVEDGIVSSQDNNLYASTDAVLGEWGKDGIYGYATAQDVTHNDVARAVYGSSFYGSTGLLPQTLTAGTTHDAYIEATMPDNLLNEANARIVLVLIDGNTNKAINVATAPIPVDASGISDAGQTAFSVRTAGNDIIVTTPTAATAYLYAASGTIISRAEGKGALRLPTEGYQGVAIVKVGDKTVKIRL